MDHVLGIDGGATTTKAVVLDASGAAVGAGEADGCNPLVCGFEEAAKRLVEAARAAAHAADIGLAYFASACYGLAGVGRAHDLERMTNILGQQGLAGVFEVDHDAAVALYGATGGKPGVITIAGTGAISFGTDADGRRARADGWGRLLGDEGSGYDLALRTLRAAARSVEGRGPLTELPERVFLTTGAADLDQLATWLYDSYRSPAEIAVLARCALEAAAENDVVASALVQESADRLAESTQAVIRQLWPTPAGVTVSYGGTLLVREGALQRLFCDAVRERMPAASVQPPLYGAAHGAALRALGKLGDAPPP
jgi:N-acetylglucosamine kinase